MNETDKRALAIRRAERRAQKAVTKLDAKTLRELSSVYREASEALQLLILNAADPQGSLVLEVLNPLLAQVRQLMLDTGQRRDQLLLSSMQTAVEAGAKVLASESAVLSLGITQVASDALEFMLSFEDQNGLQLSDRLWRLDKRATRQVSAVIRQAIVQGMGVSEATDALLDANAKAVADAATEGFMVGKGNPRAEAMRVMRTEINRAHGEAYRLSFFSHPDAVGTQFNLASNHPRKDICDMHATVNRYGLGKGVYPKGRSPWPAHPNTLSFETGVFKWQVTDEDKAGKEDRISWLKAQSATTQNAVLGQGKGAYLRSGDLSERMITSRLSAVKKRVEP